MQQKVVKSEVTLILSQLSRGFVVQASDRLVSWEGGGAYDAMSNKSIVYEAPDAIVTMAYTGVAYLDGVPTDEWLAGVITGFNWKSGKGPVGGLMLGRLPQCLHIGPMLKLVKERLEEVFGSRRLTKTARRMLFELVVAGWQWGRRKRPRPIVAVIGKKKGKTEFVIERLVRHVGRKIYGVGNPWSNLDASDIGAMLDGLGKAKSLDEVELVCVNGIRRVSDKNRYVGPDCMSVLIPPPWNGWVRIRFVPKQNWQVDLVSEGSETVIASLPAIFSPWVIGRGALQVPTCHSLGSTMQLDRFRVDFDGPKEMSGQRSGKKMQFILGPVKRPPEPR